MSGLWHFLLRALCLLITQAELEELHEEGWYFVSRGVLDRAPSYAKRVISRVMCCVRYLDCEFKSVSTESCAPVLHPARSDLNTCNAWLLAASGRQKLNCAASTGSI